MAATEAWAKGLFVSELTYFGVLLCVKFSVLAFYWRIFVMSSIRLPIYVLAASITMWFVAVVSTSEASRGLLHPRHWRDC